MTKLIMHSKTHSAPDLVLGCRDILRDDSLSHVCGQGGGTGRRQIAHLQTKVQVCTPTNHTHVQVYESIFKKP